MGTMQKKDFHQKIDQIGLHFAEAGGRHPYMRYSSYTLAIPSNAEFSVPQLKMLLKEVQQITGKKIPLKEWQEL